MKNSISILLKVVIFGAITGVGILYVINRSPVESMGTYEKQEMVKPNKDRSSFDQFFSSEPDKKRNQSKNDDVSLTGSSGRYDEVRIGKSAE